MRVFNWILFGGLKIEPCITFPYVYWSDTIGPGYGFLTEASCFIMVRFVRRYPYPNNLWGLWRWKSFCVFISFLGFKERWALLFVKCHFPAGSQLNSRRYHFFLYSDLYSRCSWCSCEYIEVFLSDFDRVLGGGVGRRVYLKCCGIINKAVS